MSEKAAPVQDPPAGADRSDEAAAPPVTSAAMPSTTAAAHTTTAMPSVATTSVTTTTAAPTATAAEMAAAPVKGAKAKNWKLKCTCHAKAAAMDSQQETSGTDHPKDPSARASVIECDADKPEETASRGVELTAVPPPPPPPVQEPVATAGETLAAIEESVQAVADLLVAEGLDGPPSNISMPGRSAPTSSGGGTPQYFDLSGQKVMPTRHEDQA